MTNEQPASYRDFYFTATDGLRLYARDYRPAQAGGRPVVCLHGFSRNSSDFHEVAVHLSRKRRVIVPDFRGRGRSAYARDWRGYTISHELVDVLDLIVALGIHDVVVLGTSRGGLIAMLMAAVRPTVIKAAILNDIGPVIETQGLLRISGQLKATPRPADWEHAALLMSQSNKHALPDLSDKQWLQFAQRRFKETDQGLVPDFDPRLSRAFDAQSRVTVGPRPEFWHSFAALFPIPVLAIRGALSEILSAETFAEMSRRHPDIKTLIVENRGHVPLLNEPGVRKAVDGLLKKA